MQHKRRSLHYIPLHYKSLNILWWTCVAHMENGLEGGLGFDVPPVASGPYIFPTEALFRQHFNRVEDVIAGGHAKVMGSQNETPAVLLRNDKNDDCKTGTNVINILPTLISDAQTIALQKHLLILINPFYSYLKSVFNTRYITWCNVVLNFTTLFDKHCL